jgi:hypothetical protein
VPGIHQLLRPFEDLEALMRFAEAYDNVLHQGRAHENKSVPKRGLDSHKTSTSAPDQTNKRRRGSDNSVFAQKPANWQPHFTPVYPKGSLERDYIIENKLCFHCLSPDHFTPECPVKLAEKEPTYALNQY